MFKFWKHKKKLDFEMDAADYLALVMDTAQTFLEKGYENYGPLMMNRTILLHTFALGLADGDVNIADNLLNHNRQVLWQTGLPKESGDYVALTNKRDIITVHFSKRYQLFNTRDEEDEHFAKRYAFNEGVVVKWMKKEDFITYMLGEKNDSQRS